jgi:hypothetical protein
MTTLQKLQIFAQVIGVAGLLITLAINYRQFRIMNAQVHEVRRSTAAQHILTLLSFIESDEIRAALNLVFTRLHKKDFSHWTEAEQQAVSKLCSSFSTAGTILQSGLVPLEPLIVGWEPSLRRCYQILKPFVLEMQKPENAGPEYWAGFDWLHDRIVQADAERKKLKTGMNFHAGPLHFKRRAAVDHGGVNVRNEQ